MNRNDREKKEYKHIIHKKIRCLNVNVSMDIKYVEKNTAYL